MEKVKALFLGGGRINFPEKISFQGSPTELKIARYIWNLVMH